MKRTDRTIYKFSRELLEAEYVYKCKSACQIAREYGCGISVVTEALYRVDILRDREIDKDILEDLYCTKKKTMEEICKLMDCNIGTVNKFVNRYNLIRERLTRRFAEDVLYKGQRFGMLTILEDPDSSLRKIKCLCDCGNIYMARIANLMERNTENINRSCGCNRVSKYDKISVYMWNNMIGGAKRRNIEFNITIEYIWDLFLKQNKKCILSGVDLDISYEKYGKKTTASLDRIDSKKGYIEGNVQWVHKDINRIKQNFTQEEFINWCKLIVGNLK